MLQIAEKPPAGLVTPADLVVCPVDPADGPLFCEYQTSRLAALRNVRSRRREAARSAPARTESSPPRSRRSRSPASHAVAWCGTASSTCRASNKRRTSNCSTSPPRSSKPCRRPRSRPCKPSPSRTSSWEAGGNRQRDDGASGSAPTSSGSPTGARSVSRRSRRRRDSLRSTRQPNWYPDPLGRGAVSLLGRRALDAVDRRRRRLTPGHVRSTRRPSRNRALLAPPTPGTGAGDAGPRAPFDFLRYRSLAGLTTALTWLLGASISERAGARDRVRQPASRRSTPSRTTAPSPPSTTLNDADDLVGAVASILGLIMLAIFVVFIVYLYRTSKNTELWDTRSADLDARLDDRRLVHPARELRHSRARRARHLAPDARTLGPTARREPAPPASSWCCGGCCS